jgi:glycosyltransferase involved in cell wall biosynthesis
LAVSGPTATAARLWERRAAGWADRLVCVSAAERDMGRAAGVEGTFAVVRTGVDRMRFRSPSQAERATARRACGIEPGPLAVCVGRASRAKGQDLLVGAWPQVRATVPEAQLALVGGGEMLESLRAQAGPGVSVLGPQADVRPWYAAADVVVLPSRWDALSLALLEACAIGSSIVATQVPGVDEVLGAAGAGAIVAAEPAALADAVAQRLRDPELVGRERRVTSEHAARDLDAAVSFDAMAGLVETVLAERLSPRRGPATGPSAAGS